MEKTKKSGNYCIFRPNNFFTCLWLFKIWFINFMCDMCVNYVLGCLARTKVLVNEGIKRMR